jgi:hypothetical protein
MNSTLRYDFDIKWSGVVIVVVFTGGLSLVTAWWAKNLGGFLSIGPMFLSVAFTLLALRITVRRLFFSRVLELTDDAILFPGGFSGKRATRIAFTEIARMQNSRMYPGMYLATTKGNFEILSIRFKSIENYRAVRNMICSRTSISLPEDVPGTWISGWVPGPVLKWSEPKDYIRYRTHLAVSRPLWLLRARAIRFFVCVFGSFFIPWLGLNFIVGFVGLGMAIYFFVILISASLFFTWLHWYNATHPARVMHITVYSDGFSVLSGLQLGNLKFGDLPGWSVVEREFEGQTFHILLLQRPKRVFEIAFPDIDTRNQFIQMLNEKKIPQLNDLKPSWELKS